MAILYSLKNALWNGIGGASFHTDYIELIIMSEFFHWNLLKFVEVYELDYFIVIATVFDCIRLFFDCLATLLTVLGL